MDKICAVAIDFDSTIAYFLDSDGNAYKNLNEIFVQQGIPIEDVKDAYEAMRPSGISFGHFMDELEKAGYPVNRELSMKECIAWLAKSLLAYPDAIDAIAMWADMGIPVFVVTTGDKAYQAQKVELTGVQITRLVAVLKDEDKISEFESLFDEYGKILVIDDKATVVDLARDADLSKDKFVTVRILRQESKYFEQAPRHKHITVTSLVAKEIQSLF